MGEKQDVEPVLRNVPASVLVGFLESGKTTVLGNLIEWGVEHDLKPGLISNECGDISIDEPLPDTIYRAKGWVCFLNEPDPFLFQYLPDFHT